MERDEVRFGVPQAMPVVVIRDSVTSATVEAAGAADARSVQMTGDAGS